MGRGREVGRSSESRKWVASETPRSARVRRRSSRRVPSLCSPAFSLFIVAGEAAAALYPEQQSEKRSPNLGGS